MKRRTAILAGFAAGYYLGAKAGRARYEQLRNAGGSLWHSEAARTIAEKSRAVATLGLERAKDLATRRGAPESIDAAATTMTGDVVSHA
ncbi:MAG: hypothetical protein M0020_00990 [Actinomycetota bacterium]|nr:hypothetical protein [Actinomycetota bacterium]